MALLHSLEIKHFRGIKEFSEEFYNKRHICLVGRGDSGKSTILEAISCVLASRWSITFYDSDFYDNNIETPIEITATLIDLPQDLLKEQYGFAIRGFNPDSGVIEEEISEIAEPAITIRLEVGKDLEPKWTVINTRNEPVSISADARSKLNAFLLSDYTDSQFSWSKGKPLYALLRQLRAAEEMENQNIVIDALRKAKHQIDQESFAEFNEVVNKVTGTAKSFGVNLTNPATTIDFRDITIRDDKVSLHDKNIPLRLKGKGTKRLVSMSMQYIIANVGGIVMIDEIEQGLEPDRVKHIVRNLDRKHKGQVFFTTHSQNVIEEVDSESIHLIKNADGKCRIERPNASFQGVVRACPEAMFAHNVIMCEGKTELGVCRAMDEYGISAGKPSFAEIGVVCSLGEGDSFTNRAARIAELGKRVCILCDSDKDGQLNPDKETLWTQDIMVFDSAEGLSIEEQIFKDLCWDGVKKIVAYADNEASNGSLRQALESNLRRMLHDEWLEQDDQEIRVALGVVSKTKGWYKRIDHGEFVGKVCLEHIYEIEGTRLHNLLTGLQCWIRQE